MTINGRKMINKIKEARLNAGLSQTQMSKFLEIPVKTLQKWEQGEREVSNWIERLVLKELEEWKMKTLAHSTKCYTLNMHLNILKRALKASVLTKEEADILYGRDEKLMSGEMMTQKQIDAKSICNKIWLFDLKTNPNELKPYLESILKNEVYGIENGNFYTISKSGETKDYKYNLTLHDEGVVIEVKELN